jgi:hypothetical protein
MRLSFLSAGLAMALISSCAPSIDDYEYGYAPAYRTLPKDFEQVEIGGTPYWHHGGRFYQYDAERGYLLVKPPQGHEQVVASTSAGAPSPNGSAPAPAAQATGGSGNPLRDLFTPGVTSQKKRGRPRTIGRSPIRRGQVIRE